LRAAGETETTQENNQDSLQLDGGDPGFKLLTEEEIAAVIFLYLFSSTLPILLNFPCIYFLSSLLSFKATFCSINPDYRLIKMKSPSIYFGIARIYCIRCLDITYLPSTTVTRHEVRHKKNVMFITGALAALRAGQ
jgi:hypothetical protein